MLEPDHVHGARGTGFLPHQLKRSGTRVFGGMRVLNITPPSNGVVVIAHARASLALRPRAAWGVVIRLMRFLAAKLLHFVPAGAPHVGQGTRSTMVGSTLGFGLIHFTGS